MKRKVVLNVVVLTFSSFAYKVPSEYLEIIRTVLELQFPIWWKAVNVKYSQTHSLFLQYQIVYIWEGIIFWLNFLFTICVCSGGKTTMKTISLSLKSYPNLTVYRNSIWLSWKVNLITWYIRDYVFTYCAFLFISWCYSLHTICFGLLCCIDTCFPYLLNTSYLRFDSKWMIIPKITRKWMDNIWVMW